MRQLLPVFCVVASVCGAVLDANAQSALVDLSKPQTGKSRYVLNSDMSPATLGSVEAKPEPVEAVERVPACGEGCKMEQPALPPAPRAAFTGEPGYYQSRSSTRAYVVAVGGKVQQQTEESRARRKTFRFRRR